MEEGQHCGLRAVPRPVSASKPIGNQMQLCDASMHTARADDPETSPTAGNPSHLVPSELSARQKLTQAMRVQCEAWLSALGEHREGAEGTEADTQRSHTCGGGAGTVRIDRVMSLTRLADDRARARLARSAHRCWLHACGVRQNHDRRERSATRHDHRAYMNLFA